jgi:hypothetical protein
MYKPHYESKKYANQPRENRLLDNHIRTYAVGVLSLRQSGTYSFLVCRFLRSASAKNDKHMIAKYHAAAGKNASL